ncbi:hypothetical protein KI387_039607, partial [Taxus chinensis]
DPEVNDPSKEGILHWEDSQSISDTTSIACDNWAHGTYELVGHEVKRTVTRKMSSHSVRCIGRVIPRYTGFEDLVGFLQAIETNWADELK